FDRGGEAVSEERPRVEGPLRLPSQLLGEILRGDLPRPADRIVGACQHGQPLVEPRRVLAPETWEGVDLEHDVIRSLQHDPAQRERDAVFYEGCAVFQPLDRLRYDERDRCPPSDSLVLIEEAVADGGAG